MKTSRFRVVVLSFLAVLAVLGACGGGDGGGGGTEVSRYAGAPPTADNTRGDFVCGVSRLQCRFSYPHGIASDNGAVYVADTNHAIRRIDMATGAGSTIAGAAPIVNPFLGSPDFPNYAKFSHIGTPGYADGTGASARFNEPHGICMDNARAYMYVADMTNHAVRRVTMASGAVTTVAGAPPAANPDYNPADPEGRAEMVGQAGYRDGSATEARFNRPEGVATDGIYLYVSDRGNNAIRRVSIDNGETDTLAGGHDDDPDIPESHIAVADYVDGTGTEARFNNPRGILLIGRLLYVADAGNHAVRAVDVDTGVVTTLAGGPPVDDDPADPANPLHGTAGFANGTGTTARFDGPDGLAFLAGSLYVADPGNQVVRRIVLDNLAVTTLAGTVGTKGSADGSRASATFAEPRGLAFHGGDLFVIETENHLVRKVLLP